MEEINQQANLKQYSLSLCETEVVLLYKLLLAHTPHMFRLEEQLKAIVQDHPEFWSWGLLFDESSSSP